MFSSVSATVHESIPQAMVSPTAWQMIVKGVMKQHGVDVHDLVIQGSWLQVEMCRLTLMKMYTECENATGKTTMGGTVNSLFVAAASITIVCNPN